MMNVYVADLDIWPDWERGNASAGVQDLSGTYILCFD